MTYRAARLSSRTLLTSVSLHITNIKAAFQAIKQDRQAQLNRLWWIIPENKIHNFGRWLPVILHLLAVLLDLLCL